MMVYTRLLTHFEYKYETNGENLNSVIASFKPFVHHAPFLYPLKTSEYLTKFWCFQGIEKGYIGNEWIKERRIIAWNKWDEIDSF